MPSEKAIWETSAPIVGESVYASYSKVDELVLTVRHPESFYQYRHAGWCWCERCKKLYRTKRPKTKYGPLKDLTNVRYRAHRDGSLTFYLPKNLKVGRCPTCGRSLKPEGDKDA